MSINYIQKKRDNKVSECNICRKSASLSWDHVPPKGGIHNLTAVEQITIFEHLVLNSDEIKPRISQNGVKYRTICTKCNARLGDSYDKELNYFALNLGKLLKSKLELPKMIPYKTKPNILIRSILGHLLAAKTALNNNVFDEKIRLFIFDEDAHLPEEIKIFYWIYPYSNITIIRDIVIGNVTKYGYFWGILKYFPIAYIVCNLEKYENLDELTIYRDCKINETREIPIHLFNIKPFWWPETPDENNCKFMAFGSNINDSVYALPKKQKNKHK